MAIPTYVAAGSFFESTGNPTVSGPAGLQDGDIVILLVETNDAAISTPTSPSLWRVVPGTPIIVTGETRLHAFWRRHVTGNSYNFGVGGSADHKDGRIFAIRGARGYPNLVTSPSSGTASGTNQTLTITGGTTTENDCLIVILGVHNIDSSSTAVWGTWTNADLANITERFENGSTQGNGGGIVVTTAEKATAGSFTDTTVVNAHTNPSWAALHLAFSPKDPPANDDFANRIVIPVAEEDDDPDYVGDGETFDASTQASENFAISGTAQDRSQWWEYETDKRRIVTARILTESTAGAAAGILGARRMPTGGTDYDDLVRYATVPNSFPSVGSFGSDDGRGISADGVVSTNSTGGYMRVQVMPDTPLYIQTTRVVINMDFFYDMEFTQYTPPVNDDLENAIALDLENDGELEYDLRPATGQPGLPTSTSSNHIIKGDVWYTVSSPVKTTISIRIGKQNVTDDQRGHAIHVWRGTNLATITRLQQFLLFGENASVDQEFTQVQLEAGETYFFQVAWQIFNNPGVDVSVGKIEWINYPAPPNDEFEDAEVISGDSGFTSVADMRGATSETQGFYSIWYDFTPTTGGWYEFELDIIPLNQVRMVAYRGTSFNELEMTDESYSEDEFMRLALRGGESYKIAIFTNSANRPEDLEGITWSLLSSPPANDDFSNALLLVGASGSEPIDYEGSTREASEESARYWSNPTPASIWMEWNCPVNGIYEFHTEDFTPSDGFNGQMYAEMAIWQGNQFVDGIKIAGNSQGQQSTENKIAFDATTDEPYFIHITAYKDFGTQNWPSPRNGNIVWGSFVKSTNELFSNAIEFGGGTTGSEDWNNYGLSPTLESGVPDLSLYLGGDISSDAVYGRGLWFKFTADYSGIYDFTFDSIGGEFATHWFAGSSLETLTPMIPYDDGFTSEGTAGLYVAFDAGYTQSIEFVGGETYYLFVTGLTFDTNEFWSLAEISQGDIHVEWSIRGPENDDIISVSNALVENPGNLNFYNPYYFNGINQGPYVSLRGSGACKTANNIGATAQVGEPSHAGGFAATRSMWYTFRPADTGTYKIWVEPAGPNPVADPLLAVYNQVSTIGALGAALASDDDSGPGLYPEVSVSLTAFTRYLIVVDARDEGEFTLHVQKQPVGTPPANDDFSDAVTLLLDIPQAGTTVDSTFECGEQPVAGFADGPFGSVWYKFVATETTTALVSLTTVDPIVEYTFIDIYRGTTLNNILNITDTDNYWNGSFEDTIMINFSVEEGETYYFRISAYNDEQAPFTLELITQSTTPPDNDDSGNASDAPSAGGNGGNNVFPGTTDGAGVTPGEPDPSGGTLDPETEASTWHRYTPDAPGFVAIYTTRDDAPQSQWYRVGVYEGDTLSSSLLVQSAFSYTSGTPRAFYYEVRAGETYWIQVIRGFGQSWGEYDLHIDEYLETIDWDMATDGFDSLTGAADVTAGILTVTGNEEALGDHLDYEGQYGNIDIGYDRKFGRETRIHFDLRIVGGQILYRAHSYGGDDWGAAAAASDDHTTYTTRRVGLVRGFDIDGSLVFYASIAPNNKGENFLELSLNNVFTTSVSLGAHLPQHDTGWISIELVLTASNTQAYNASSVAAWDLTGHIDGRPIPTTSASSIFRSNMKPLRHLDFGMFRHPSMYNNGTSASDQRYVENNETWTYEMKNVRVSNIVPQDPIDCVLADDKGIFEFDGFASEVGWKAEGNRHNFAVSSGSTLPVETFPDKTWGSFRDNGSPRARIYYAHQHGSRRVYGISVNYASFPSDLLLLSGYSTGSSLNISSGMGVLSVDETGELRIRPYAFRSFCVAKLEEGQHYFIEVHIDAEVMWDVRCTVYINEQLFGTYTNAITYSEVASSSPNSFQTGPIPSEYKNQWYSVFGETASSTITRDIYYSNAVVGRRPGDMIGAVQTVAISAAAVGELGHYIPEYPTDPSDRMELLNSDNEVQHLMYSWMGEWEEAGPYSIIWPDAAVSGDHARFYPWTKVPRFWEAYYTLKPTYPLELSGSDFTKFGQSVPIDATIAGIFVQAPTGGTAQLLKDGSPVGSSLGDTGGVYGDPEEMWSTTWTPFEINSEGFGVRLTGVGASTSQVRIFVYFADEGGPSGISRGGGLDPTGLYNFYGDQLVATWLATGDMGTMHGGGIWEGGGEPGGTRGPERTLSGTPQQIWTTLFPLWFWQARGEKEPSIDWKGVNPNVGETAEVTDYKIVRNPLIYPRFAYSSDNGLSITWVTDLNEGDTPDYISGDVGAASTDEVVFLDNNAALDRFEINNGSWAAGLSEDRPSASQAYRMTYWYLEYGHSDGPTGVISANFWARYRAYSGFPSETEASSSIWRAYASDIDGKSSKRIGTFTGGGTQESPSIARFTVPRQPNSEAWNTTDFDNTTARIGFNQNVSTSNGFSWLNNTANGAAIYALTWELLIPAEADPPPAPCGGWVDLTRVKFRGFGFGDV